VKNNEINILKHTLYFLFFIILTLFLFFWMIIPSYRDFKINNITYKKEKSYLSSVKKSESKYIATLKDLKSKNRNQTSAFSKKFNKELFIKANSKFFKNLTVKVFETKPFLEEFQKQHIRVEGLITSPKEFYSFIDNLKQNDIIIEIHYPIEFKVAKDMIETKIDISICSELEI